MKSLLLLSVLFFVGCGQQLLEDGAYRVKIIKTQSDWTSWTNEEDVTETIWYITEEDSKYFLHVDKTVGAYEGVVNENHILFHFYEEFEKGSECVGFNELFVDLLPEKNHKSFTGEGTSELKLCHVAKCQDMMNPECRETSEVSLKESYLFEGEMK